MHDRRAITRWQVDKQIKVKIEGAENFADCLLKDINLKGAKIILRMRLKKDTFIKVDIVLSQDFVLKAEIWIAWHRIIEGEHIYGVYFSKIRDADKDRIYKLLREFIPQRMNKRWWSATDERGETMAGENIEDRRIFERFNTEMPVRFLESTGTQENTARTFDISAKGVGLVSKDRIPEKSALEVWLQIPDKGEPVYSRGEVVWSKSTGINEYRSGISLEKADLMGLSRVLRVA